MSKKSLDIIIPAYNSYDYLVRSLASLSLQKVDFPLNVIIINDASERNYKKEIMLFADKINIKEIVLDKNSGVGVARQVGLDNSNGDYIVFLDSDDLLYEEMSLQKLYDLIADKDYDYAYAAILIENGKSIQKCDYHDGCLHGKIFSRKFIRDNNIRFNTTRTSEDNSFNNICLLKTRKINSSNDIVYIYKDNSFSLTKGLDLKKIISNMVDYTDNVIYTLDNVENKLQREVIAYYLKSYFYIWENYNYYNKKYPEESKIIYDCLKKIKKATPYFTDDIINEYSPEIAFSNFKNTISE